MGRTLRDWCDSGLGDSTSALFALRDEVCRVTGLDFAVAVGPTMAAAFEARLDELMAKEAEEGNYAVYEEGARVLGHPHARVLSVIHLRAGSSADCRRLAVASAGDRRMLFGRVDGIWREFEIETLLDAVFKKDAAC